MLLDVDTINALKDSLRNAPCNWCGGVVELEGIHKIEGDTIQAVICCSKCDRVNPATFKARD